MHPLHLSALSNQLNALHALSNKTLLHKALSNQSNALSNQLNALSNQTLLHNALSNQLNALSNQLNALTNQFNTISNQTPSPI